MRRVLLLVGPAVIFSTIAVLSRHRLAQTFVLREQKITAQLAAPPQTEVIATQSLSVVPTTNISEDPEYAKLVDSVRPYEPNPRPPLKEVVDGWNITGDPQWLMNFAIIAFPKCGTSTLMHYFDQNDEVQIHTDERCELGSNQHAKLIQALYKDFPAGDYVRGIKCPRDLEGTSLGMNNYVKFFPKTDLIVGLRHPIKWFESFYNHRVHNGMPMPHTSSLTGRCIKKTFGCCATRAMFHAFLANLGKVNMSDPEISDLVPKSMGRFNFPMQGRIFVYDVQQLSEPDEARALEFRQTLQRFLRLRNPLPPMVWFKPQRKKPEEVVANRINKQKIDICDEEHTKIRSVLMQHAVNASRWIRRYFVAHPDVHVAVPDAFHEILAGWETDPCENGSFHRASGAVNCTKYGCFMMTNQTRR